jgi:dynein heavy chain
MKIFQDLPLKYEYKKELLLVGVSGTAKTSTILMFCENTFGTTKLLKKVNFSSATLPKNFQDILESSLEKRNAKNYAPPG